MRHVHLDLTEAEVRQSVRQLPRARKSSVSAQPDGLPATMNAAPVLPINPLVVAITSAPSQSAATSQQSSAASCVPVLPAPFTSGSVVLPASVTSGSAVLPTPVVALACSKCGRTVKRLDIHVVRVHTVKSGTADYQAIMRDLIPSVARVPPSTTLTLEGLLDDFEQTIQSLAGGRTEPRQAKQKRNAVSRVLYKVVGDDAWSPAILRTQDGWRKALWRPVSNAGLR